MRAFRMTAFAASLLLASGCVVVSGPGGGGGGSGDLTVHWTFGGSSCAAAGVDTISIQVTGPNDSASKQVSCSADPQGITITNFIPDTYQVTITGYDTASNAIYGMAAAQSVTITDGQTSTYSIDVPSLVGDLTVLWGKFGTYQDCATASIPNIEAVLTDSGGNQVSDQTYKCSDGGVTFNQIPPDTYTIDLYGMDSTGLVYFTASSQVDVAAGQANDYTVDLADNTGTLTIEWQFAGSTACGSVTDVHLTITDANNNDLVNTSYPCSDGSHTFPTVPAGAYTVAGQGIDGNGQVLYQGTNSNVSVTAGTTQQFIVNMN